MAKKYLIISLGRKETMGPGGDGKNEAGGVLITPDYPEGYLPITGTWRPVALGVDLFDTEEKMEAWLDSPKGQEWTNGVEHAIKVQLEVK